MSVTLKLPERLDSAAAGPLAEALMSARGQPVLLDGSDVMFGGALGLQVLLAACSQWQHDARGFQLEPLSAGLTEACRLLGIAPEGIGATAQPGGAA